jgi:CO/xanthine dehydrogenase FAD-binding subunit
MTTYQYYKPRTLKEAIDIRNSCEEARYIAGGTDVMVGIRDKQIVPKALVSLRNVEELRTRKTAWIGSGITHRELENDVYVKERLTALHDAVSVLGSCQVRNVATIGGNITSARPAADTPPGLLCMGARFRLRGVAGEREISADDFFVGPGETVILEDEVLTGIVIDELPPFTGTSYMKLARRKAVDIAIAGVASRITLDQQDGLIIDAKVILSAVAPKAIHAAEAERILIGRKPEEALFEAAGAEASKACSPITDIRAGESYRHAMVGVLTKRTLRQALLRARGV